MGTENFSLFEQWFRLADEDNDGKVAGAEAVKFFKRSELPQPVLAQVWQVASAGAPALSKPQFSAAMQLVSLAQTSGGSINPQVARQITMGLGPRLPPPRMTGLSAPQGGAGTGSGGQFPPSGSTGGYFAQPHSAPFPPSGPTGSMMPPTSGFQQMGAHPSSGFTGGYSRGMGAGGGWPGAHPGAYPGAGPTGGGFPSSGSTGGSFSPSGFTGSGYPGAGPTGGSHPPSGSTGGGLPPMGDAEERQYLALFERLDPQRSGAAQGAAVFPVFSSSGLPRDILSRIWSLVAGTRGSLSRQEFVSAHYLLDCARRGLQLPESLPPGAAFPPRQGAPPGALPPQPPVVAPEDPISAVNDAFASLGASMGVPQSLISGPTTAPTPPPPSYMGPTEDMQAYGVTDPADLPHRKKAFFEQSLQELTLFRRRMEGQLLQMEGSGRTTQEAAQLEADYKKLHEATTQAAEGASALEQEIEQSLLHKEEAERRFEELNQQQHSLSSVRAEDVQREEAAAAAAESAASAAEARAAELQAALQGSDAKKAELRARLAAQQQRKAVAEAQEGKLGGELSSLRQQLEGAMEADPARQLAASLKQVVALHASLTQELARAGAPPPPPPHSEADAKSGLQWRADAAAFASDGGTPGGAAGSWSSAGPAGLLEASAPPPAAGTFSKGEAVWYVKNGQRLEGTVMSIDRSISPPSYVVQLASGERETEGSNLRPRSAFAPEAAFSAGDDMFGDSLAFPPASDPSPHAPAAAAAHSVSRSEPLSLF
eukprot:jgi/Tetstr1/461332/TSEL_006458.t1